MGAPNDRSAVAEKPSTVTPRLFTKGPIICLALLAVGYLAAVLRYGIVFLPTDLVLPRQLERELWEMGSSGLDRIFTMAIVLTPWILWGWKRNRAMLRLALSVTGMWLLCQLGSLRIWQEPLNRSLSPEWAQLMMLALFQWPWPVLAWKATRKWLWIAMGWSALYLLVAGATFLWLITHYVSWG